MADGEDIPKSPVGPDVMKLMETFMEMGVRPKADTPEQLNQWMIDHLRSIGAISTADVKPKMQRPPPPKPTTTDKPQKMTVSLPPKLTLFSGHEPPKNGETTYELWKHEVKCLLRQSYDKDIISNAILRSLRGEAAYVAMRLQPDATVDDIIAKLDSVYGDVDKKEDVLAEFYGSRQREDESVTSWSCRLEAIIGKAVERGLVHSLEVDGMLHSMLWTGLKTSLKDISGYKYDSISDFDGLRVALRQIEKDHESREPKKTSKPHTVKQSANKSDFEELKGMMKQMNTRMDSYEKKLEQLPMQQQRYQQQTWQHPPYQQQTWQQPPPQWKQQDRGRGRNQYTNRGRGQPSPSPYRQTTPATNDDYQCWRCGQWGHLKIGCKVRLDHSRRDLNARKPMQREHP